MYLTPIDFSKISRVLAKSAKDAATMSKSIADDALKSSLSKICILGSGFPNPVQAKLAEKYLLNNDEFMKTATDLVQKTGAKITIIPRNKASSSIGMQILDGKIPFDLFAKDKTGAKISGFIDARDYTEVTKDAVNRFLDSVRKYIGGK